MGSFILCVARHRLARAASDHRHYRCTPVANRAQLIRQSPLQGGAFALIGRGKHRRPSLFGKLLRTIAAAIIDTKHVRAYGLKICNHRRHKLGDYIRDSWRGQLHAAGTVVYSAGMFLARSSWRSNRPRHQGAFDGVAGGIVSAVSTGAWLRCCHSGVVPAAGFSACRWAGLRPQAASGRRLRHRTLHLRFVGGRCRPRCPRG